MRTVTEQQSEQHNERINKVIETFFSELGLQEPITTVLELQQQLIRSKEALSKDNYNVDIECLILSDAAISNSGFVVNRIVSFLCSLYEIHY